MNIFIILGFVVLFVVLFSFVLKKKKVTEEEIKHLLSQGDTKQAKKKLQKVLSHSNSPDYHFLLAHVYETEFNFEHAILEYKIILKMKKFSSKTTYKNVIVKLIENYKRINKVKDAILFLEKEKETNKSYIVLLQLAHLYNLSNQVTKSMPLVDELLKTNPNDSEALTELGVIEMEKGNDSKALETFELAIKLKNKNYYAFYYMGLLYQKKGLFDKAIMAYERSKNLPCLKLVSLRNIGDCYKSKDMIKNATDTYELAVNEWDNNIFYREITSTSLILQIRYALAECYVLDKNYQNALDQWRLIQSIDSNYRDVMLLIQSNARFGKDRIQDFLITSDIDFKKIITFATDYLAIRRTKLFFYEKEIIAVEGISNGKPVLVWAVRSSHPVGEKIVSNFYQMMQNKKIPYGMILSANGFSPNGIRSSLGKPIKLLGKGPMLKIIKAYENRA